MVKGSWGVFGRPNASAVMAAFLHGSPNGLRFSSATLGAWYASTELGTAVLEVANGLRKEFSLTSECRILATCREYKARLLGDFIDIFGLHPEFHNADDASYPVPQVFGEQLRKFLDEHSIVGLRYESVRHSGF